MRVIAAGLGALALLVAGAAPSAADDGDPDVVFSFQDPAISESSALVPLRGGLYATTNDSGDSGRVFVVDGRGTTVGVTYWSADPTDVEALAPAPDGRIWVGDIGDNEKVRSSVQVAEVSVGRGTRNVSPVTYELVYPDGPHDAETLLCDPHTGRLYVASKDWGGGTLYAAPRRLSSSHANAMTAVGRVMPMATDGAIFPSGKVAVIRGYYGATAYAWPSMDRIGAVPLPSQDQGEGIGVTSRNAIVLSSEGLHSQVVRAGLPTSVETALKGEKTPPPKSPSADPTPGNRPEHDSHDDSDGPGSGGAGAGLLVAVVVAAWLLWPRRKK